MQRRNHNIKFREKLNSILTKNSMQDVYLVRKQLADSDRQEINEDLVQALKTSVMESTGTFGATEKKQPVAQSTEYILPNGSLLNHLSQQFLSNPTPENLNNLRKSVN